MPWSNCPDRRSEWRRWMPVRQSTSARSSSGSGSFRPPLRRGGGVPEAHRAALEILGGLSERVTLLAAKLTEIVPDEDGEAKVYRPGPAPRWWKLSGEDRDEAVAQLRAWVDQIYRPMYGHLAVLGPCWQSHPLLLFPLDWLCELWSLL